MTMGEKSKDSQTPKTEAEKKQPETVLLSAEELRAIAGGAGVTTGPYPTTTQPPSTQIKPTG
jgi:hypothetical protein